MSKQTWKPGNMLYPVPAVMVSCQRGDEKPNMFRPCDGVNIGEKRKIQP